MNHKLSEKWIKASVVGTMWAASEIVLGSFLHNLKIPFSGNILTAIGIIILISISYIWNEKGLFWRAGLICAIMKTMSPSAVIFGPMIAIFAESLLLEISVTLLGRTILGYITGAMLAMSWNLFHKIISYIVYYGSDIIGVYTNLLKMAQKQLNIQTDIVWLPVILLLVVYALFGLAAGVVGIRVGRRMLNDPAAIDPVRRNNPSVSTLHSQVLEFDYSIAWLILAVLMIVSSFLLLTYTQWYVWAPLISFFSVIWALRYRRAMRQLSKPKFWIIFVLITLLTAFVFTAGSGADSWKNGLLAGISMNFRAVVIIMGFSALGTELYNPRVRSFFSRTAFRNLPLAVELSVESLPDFIATIPDVKSIFRRPVSLLYQVLSHAENRLSEIKGENRRIFIVAGERAAGKTTFIKDLASYLKGKRIRIGGFIAERIMSGTETTGYDLVNVTSAEKTPFLRVADAGEAADIGKYRIMEEGIEYGRKILRGLLHGRNRIVIVDEVGMLELRGEGWSENIGELVAKSHNHLLLVVRTEFTEKVISEWDLQQNVLINIGETDYRKAGDHILKLLIG